MDIWNFDLNFVGCSQLSSNKHLQDYISPVMFSDFLFSFLSYNLFSVTPSDITWEAYSYEEVLNYYYMFFLLVSNSLKVILSQDGLFRYVKMPSSLSLDWGDHLCAPVEDRRSNLQELNTQEHI